MIKQYDKSVLRIFDPYYQILAKEVIWDDQGIPKNKEDQELDDELENQLDWVEIKELEEDIALLNERSLEEVEEMPVVTFATAAHGFSTKKACNNTSPTAQST